jgi:hypothetical protein
MTGRYTDDISGGSLSLVREMEMAKKEIVREFRVKSTDSIKFALSMKLVHDRERETASLSMEAYWD